MGINALEPQHLKRAFLTHLHSDHTAGYPDLILTPWVLERNEPLEVYGPTGVQTMTDHVLAAYEADIQEPLYRLEPANTEGYKVNVHEIKTGVVYEDANVRVRAFPVNHGSWPAFGFRFDTPDRSIVISGDTKPVETLIQNNIGCDVLIHEVYSAEGFKTRPPEWQNYHAHVHTSTHELAEVAAKILPGLLILYHQLFWGHSDDELLWEIRQGYGGVVVSGQDLEVY
jgi:ribonuclease BN (tRNA processing enzyme)